MFDAKSFENGMLESNISNRTTIAIDSQVTVEDTKISKLLLSESVVSKDIQVEVTMVEEVEVSEEKKVSAQTTTDDQLVGDQ
jgi:hypothetical protein